MFRELDNPKINLDEASTKMIFSFRALYMGLAQIVAQENGDVNAASAILEMMEKVMPSAYHSFDKSLRTDLANFYLMVGDTTRYIEIAKDMEEYFVSQLDTDDPGNNPTGRNAYIFLLSFYEASGRYQDAINLLERLKGMYPNDPSIAEQIQSLQRRLDGTPEQPLIVDSVAP
jgi:tetratricopeptide (TPR) repeat protein